MSKSTIQRQKLIADLIEEGKITSQNQLKGMLKKEGISITQATPSRDLTEIGASKKRDSNNNLKYILPKDDVNNAQKSIAKKALRDFVLSVEPVSNQVIIKTTTAGTFTCLANKKCSLVCCIAPSVAATTKIAPSI